MSESALSRLYGSGVFTTIRIINGEPWLWEKHWRRLMNDAAKIGIGAEVVQAIEGQEPSQPDRGDGSEGPGKKDKP